MVKKTLIYIICFIPLAATAQSNNTFVAMHAFKYTGIEKQVPLKVITSFITQNKNFFPAYTDSALATQTLCELCSHLHFIDVNNDGLEDVIFEGQDTAEGHIVKLFINNGKSYDKVFEDKQGITSMVFNNNKRLNTLQVGDWGCCGAYLNFDRSYAVSFTNNNLPVFTLVNQAAAVFDGAEPDSMLINPFTCSVVNYNTPLRSSPAADDSSYAPWQFDSIPRGSGNTIGLLSKNITCTVIGKKAGIEGWWYIELSGETPVHRGAFYLNNNKFPTKKRGWLRNNDLHIQ